MTTTGRPHAGAAGVAGLDEVFRANVIVVTGKGGVGKTTVAAALGLALSQAGRSTLLVSVEGRDSLSRALDTAPFSYDEHEFRPGLSGTALDPTESVLEYLELFYGLRRLQWLMQRSNALDFVTAAAPGLRDLLLVGKVYEIEARRRNDGRRRYDTIIIDAPPTGRIVPFLRAPDAVTEIVRVGPIRRQASQITSMLANHARTQVVLVSLLEEMPVTETIEAAGALTGAGLAVGPIIANRTEPEVMSRADANLLARVGRERLAAVADRVGVDWSLADVDALRRAGHDHRDRVELEAEMAAVLATASDMPMIALRRRSDVAARGPLAAALAADLAEAVARPPSP